MDKKEELSSLKGQKSSHIPTESRLVHSKSFHVLDNIEIDLEIPDNDFNVEEFIKINCTYLKYGNEPQNQQGYTCSQCNPSKNLIICETCYKECHKSCLRTQEDKLVNEDGQNKPFACFCGQRLKHWNIHKKFEQTKKQCTMAEFDRKIRSTRQYYCQTHKFNLCSICAKDCHANCPDVIIRETQVIVDCLCSDNNHSEYNEFTFSIVKKKNEDRKSEKAHTISNLRPIQILNVLFETKSTYNQLISFVETMINTGAAGPTSRFENPFPRIIGLFSDTFDRKFKTCYYHKIIHDLFKYEKLTPFMKNIEIQNASQRLLKFRFIFILLFIQLKYDFQLIKTLTSIDFICAPILQRLLYRKFVFTPSIYTKEIIDKYKFTSDDTGDILNIKNTVVNEIIKFMNKSFKAGLSMEIYHQEYEIALKCICFMLKHMLFNRKELETLIELLYEFWLEFDSFIEVNKEAMATVNDIFNCMVEICVLIGVNYNDLVVYNYLTKMKVTHFDSSKVVEEFIHVKNDANGMLFKIVVKSCNLVVQHYKAKKSNDPELSGFQFSDKILFLFDQALKLFAIADNFYYTKLCEITEEDVINFYDLYNKIHNNKNLTYVFLNDEGQSNDSLFTLKNNIEQHLCNFFITHSEENSNISKKLYSELENFSRKMNEKFLLEPQSGSKDSSTAKDGSIENKRIRDFSEKIIKVVKRIFPFIAHESFKEKIPQFVDALIFSNMDETIFKVLVHFSNPKYKNEIDLNLLNQILGFLSMFLLTRKGFEYFLLGKNLTRMNKLFNRFRFKDKDKNVNPQLGKSKENNIIFSKKILEFISLLFKGMKYHNFTITGHKVLFRLIKNMLNHIENYKTEIKTNLPNFKKNLVLVMGIFNLSNDMISESIFEEIKSRILALFDIPELNFFKNEKNIEMFILEEKDDKGVPLNENEILSLKENTINTTLQKKNNNNQKQFDVIRENSIDDGDFSLQTETEDGNQLSLNENLYQEFFELVVNKTYYIYNDNEKGKQMLPQNFIKSENLEKYKATFKNQNFSIKLRRSLLNYFRTFYFIDVIDRYDITKMSIQLTTNEYIKYESEKKGELKDKYAKLLDIQKIIDIFTQEIEMFPGQVLRKSPNDVLNFIKDLILSVKFIADFFYKERNIWSKSCLSLYKLATHFINKCATITKVFKDIEEKGKPIENNSYIPNEENIELLYTKMTKRSFDIINKNDIYDFLSIAIDCIFKETQLNKEFQLQDFLKKFDSASDANFTPFSLVKEKDYEYFYEDEECEFDSLSYSLKKVERLKEYFTKFCTDIDNTVFLDIISGISNEADQIDYRREILDYFITYLHQCKEDEFTSNQTIGILCVVTKMLFYDTGETQENFKCLLDDQYDSFFKKLKEVLKMHYVRIFTASRNIFISHTFLQLTNFTKLLLQFLQLLGEGFNKDFHEKILCEGDNLIEESSQLSAIDTFHKCFVENLVYVSQFMHSDKLTSYELPFSKLIVLTSNLVDIIVEYMEVEKKNENRVAMGMTQLLRDGFFDTLFNKIDFSSEEYLQNSKIIMLIKGKILDLLISFLQNGDKKNDIRQYLKMISPSVLFEQILHHFQAIEKVKAIHAAIDAAGEKKFVSTLIHLYVYDSEFSNDMNLQLCFKMFNLIKIYEDLYQIKTLEHTMEKISEMDPKRMPTREVYGLNSKFAYKLRLFLEELVLKVYIKRILEEKDEEEDEIELNYITFFIRPPLTFHLSSQTMSSFEENVDRSSTSSKLQYLLFYSDYFIFEMVANSRLLGPSSWSKFINILDFHYVEIVSYLLLIIQNIIMIVYHYKSVDLDDEEYGDLDTDALFEYIPANLIIALVHLVFLLFMVIIWFNYKFPLSLEKNILINNTTNFVFRKASDKGKKKISQELRDFFDEEVKNSRILPVIASLNREVNFFNQLYNGIFDSILFNREICILLYTIVFIVVYLATRCIIWLAIPLMFIMNLNATLFNVFTSVKDHIGQLVCILIFMYLFAYNFMWISFHFMSNIYTLEDVYDRNIDDYVPEEEAEEFCTSSVPCLLNIIDYFIVSYYPTTPKVSFKNDPGFFVINFFYDFLFFIIIALIMVNVFLGVLYDTFGELREILQQKENDIKNVCFICQMTRDGSLSKNIDFNNHVVKEHSMWNYVYFLIFLHISNPNNFNGNQNYVWDKLGEQDSSWIPHDNDADEDDGGEDE